MDNLPCGKDEHGEILGVCRGADLVEYHLQGVTLRSQPQHRLDKIIAVWGVEPCGTEDYALAA